MRLLVVALSALLLPAASCARVPGVPGAASPVIDAEVRVLVRTGPARVLVELHVAEGVGLAGERLAAIALAQDNVLSRLASARISVVRRYASVPLLALEIDAQALTELERMSDLVVSVRPDAKRGTSSYRLSVWPGNAALS